MGYAIYRRLLVGATLVIYRAGAGVSASCERQGVYHSMTRAIFAAEWPSKDEIYYSWRTRNPAIWIANTKFCRAVTPTPVRDSAEHHHLLQDVAMELVKEMYPDTPLELPSMVMRHVYDHIPIANRRGISHGQTSTSGSIAPFPIRRTRFSVWASSPIGCAG